MPPDHHPNISNVVLDIYRLVTIFLSSEKIAELTVSPHYGEDPLRQFDEFERDEITRILLTVAITVRVIDDRSARLMNLLAGPCGELVPDMSNPQSEALDIREACNKIIHSLKIQPEKRPLPSGVVVLVPRILLFGHSRGGDWKATLDVVNFCRECTAMLKALTHQGDVNP
jgi:hypothetical protein